MNLRKAGESVGWLNSQGPISVSPSAQPVEARWRCPQCERLNRMSATYCRCEYARIEGDGTEILECIPVPLRDARATMRYRPDAEWIRHDLMEAGRIEGLVILMEKILDIEESAFAEQPVYHHTGRYALLIRGAHAGLEEFIEAARAALVAPSLIEELQRLDPRMRAYPNLSGAMELSGRHGGAGR